MGWERSGKSLPNRRAGRNLNYQTGRGTSRQPGSAPNRPFQGAEDRFYFLRRTALECVCSIACTAPGRGTRGHGGGGVGKPDRTRTPGYLSVMPPQYIFTIENLSKAYAKKEVLKNIWLSFYPGAKIGVIGGNGSGKSTLLRIMAGLDKDFIGTARPAPGTTIGYRAAGADARPGHGRPRQRRAGRGRRLRNLLNRFDEINARLGEPLGRRRDGEAARGAGQGAGCDRRRQGLGPRPPDRDRHGRHAAATRRGRRQHPLRRRDAGGWRSARSCSNDPISSCSTSRRTTSTPRASPGSNGIWRNIPARSSPSPTIATSSITSPSWILELDRGQGIPWQGNYSSWLEQKQDRLAKEEKQESTRRKTLARELEWVRMAPRARVAKNRARLQRYEQLAGQDADRRDEAIVLQIPPGPHLGDLVVEAEDVKKGYGDRLLFEDMNFRLPPGGIIGVIGPNGAGKTTLFRMIVGQETPDGGTLRVGDTVVTSYVDQNRDALNPENTVFQEITGGLDQIVLGKRKVAGAGLRRLVQLQGARPGEEGRQPLRRRAQPGPPGQAAQERRQPPAPRRADQRPRRRHAPRPRRGDRSISAAAPWSSATTAGSSTGSPPTSSPSRATARSSGATATTRPTSPSATSGSGSRPTSRTGSGTGR